MYPACDWRQRMRFRIAGLLELEVIAQHEPTNDRQDHDKYRRHVEIRTHRPKLRLDISHDVLAVQHPTLGKQPQYQPELDVHLGHICYA